MLNFERSPDTEAVIIALRGVNEEATYQGLAKQANMSLLRLKSVLRSARQILRREKILFGTITGVGVKRLADTDKVRKSEDNKKRMANAAKRGIKELDTIEHFELLIPIDQLTVTTNRTIFHLTRQQLKAMPKAEPVPASSTTASNADLAANLVKMVRK
jgi:hypothetical protein